MRTVKLPQVEGASGFQHLKEDLEERARIRSGGRVKKILIKTLLFE
jgi:flagellar FliL protein